MPKTFFVGSLIGEKGSPIQGYLLAFGLGLEDFAFASRSAFFRSSLALLDSESALEEKYFDVSGLNWLSSVSPSEPFQERICSSKSLSLGAAKSTFGASLFVRFTENHRLKICLISCVSLGMGATRPLIVSLVSPRPRGQARNGILRSSLRQCLIPQQSSRFR